MDDERATVIPIAMGPGPIRAAIVLSPDATDEDVRAVIPQALALQKQANNDHWYSAWFVKEASIAQKEGRLSYAQLARWGNWEIWQTILNVAQFGRDNLAPDYVEAQVDLAIRQLIAIRGKRAAKECRQAVAEALELAETSMKTKGQFITYTLVDTDMMKMAIRRHRQGWVNSPDSPISKE